MHTNPRRHTAFILAGLLLLLAGCGAPGTAPEGQASPAAPAGESCTTKECFITAAAACKEARLTLTEDAGTFTYAASAGCVFTKTLTTPAQGETPEMKALLQGKSMTCTYAKGTFDARWVTSVVYGIERCEGPLREVLAQLAAFA